MKIVTLSTACRVHTAIQTARADLATLNVLLQAERQTEQAREAQEINTALRDLLDRAATLALCGLPVSDRSPAADSIEAALAAYDAAPASIQQQDRTAAALPQSFFHGGGVMP